MIALKLRCILLHLITAMVRVIYYFCVNFVILSRYFSQTLETCTQILCHFYVAENDSNKRIIRRLLDAGVDMDMRTEWGDTAAHYAARHGTYEVLEFLCEEGISVNRINVGKVKA